ncbi:cytochrome P450 [Syncephalis pseudoplumigaleata]|uniref:Cytochrome P450 n=1 Tax=Syncephalis pseudoplumigaleata TaxID=1712513 RepID=A0A4P9Z3W6_9FUNG|nr:cytochrome P450 [Syncephalis pseudoplumigaleata]|eukprot:RKP27244.1 cytochrome P450 [Syncephalis pseudoplumigaleata]
MASASANIKYVAAVCGLLLLAKAIYRDFFSPASKVPGLPFLTFLQARWIYNTVTGNYVRHQYAMFKRYGRIVRLTPTEIGLSDPDAIKAMLTSPKFRKTDAYANFQFHGDNIFSTQDVALHRKLKRMIGPVFSPSSVAEVEPLVREAGVKRLAARIAEYAEAGATFNIMELFLYTSCVRCSGADPLQDVIGEVAFGGTFNTLLCKPGEKPHPVIHWINDITYLGILLPLRLWRQFTRSVIKKRLQENSDQADRGEHRNGYVKDVLQRMLESKDELTGSTFDIDELISQSIAMLVGGTDTTAVTLTWGMHLLCNNPKVARALKEELMAAFPDPDQTILHEDTKHLTYLNATIYEILRLYTVATGSQRVTPPEGAVICDIFIPGGYVISPIVEAVHQNTAIYGKDPRAFNPRRWIDVEPDQLFNMRQSLLSFSMGSRACIGQKTDMTPTSLFILKPYDEKLLVRAVSNVD